MFIIVKQRTTVGWFGFLIKICLQSNAPTQCGNCHICSKSLAMNFHISIVGCGKYNVCIVFHIAMDTSFTMFETVRSLL